MAITNQRRSDINFMNPLFILDNILAILPRYSVLTKCQHTSEMCYKFYTILVFLIVIIGNGLSVYGRFKDVYPTFRTAALITTDLAVVFSTTTTNILAILVPLLRFDTYKIFFTIFLKADSCLLKDQSVKTKKCKSFYIELIVGHLVLLALFIFDAYVWISHSGFTIFRHYIFRNLQFYHLFITSMTMFNFALSMKYRLQVLNNTLKNLTDIPTCSAINNVLTIKIKKGSWERHQVVRDIALMYETQINQISLFNKLFGWQILFMTLSTMMGLLNCLDLITVYVLIGHKEGTGATYGYDLIILSFLWALCQLIIEGVVVFACSGAQRTAKETADVCFNQLLKLPVISKNPQERALRDEFQMLSQLAVQRCPSFTAADFFSVDCSLILVILGSVTSYVIVLIQFTQV